MYIHAKVKKKKKKNAGSSVVRHSPGYFRRDTPACFRGSARRAVDDRCCPVIYRSRNGSPGRRTASCIGCPRASGSSCCSAETGIIYMYTVKCFESVALFFFSSLYYFIHVAVFFLHPLARYWRKCLLMASLGDPTEGFPALSAFNCYCLLMEINAGEGLFSCIYASFAVDHSGELFFYCFFFFNNVDVVSIRELSIDAEAFFFFSDRNDDANCV